jgi:hypothetical protein
VGEAIILGVMFTLAANRSRRKHMGPCSSRSSESWFTIGCSFLDQWLRLTNQNQGEQTGITLTSGIIVSSPDQVNMAILPNATF